MKTRVRNKQTRCRVAGGEESFVLDFLFLFIKKKEKYTVFEPFNLRIYFENFTKGYRTKKMLNEKRLIK